MLISNDNLMLISISPVTLKIKIQSTRNYILFEILKGTGTPFTWSLEQAFISCSHSDNT